MKKNKLDDMDLPSVNPKEELERISRDKFRPLFDGKLFEIREGIIKDVGIDYYIELKYKDRYSGFQFNVQLKATEKVPNKDGSFSIQIDTSNIEYLLNSGNPCFYVVYDKTNDLFYYEYLNDFVSQISKKDNEWDKQGSHVLRVKKQLANNEIEKIYNITFDKGIANRSINEKLAIKSATADHGDKILIDYNNNVTSDDDIRKIIENFGFILIDACRWKEIIDLNSKASNNIGTTALYNLILGTAHCYESNFFDALSFLKKANGLKSELSEELKWHLEYMYTTSKYTFGIIPKEEYEKVMSKLENSGPLGLYIRFYWEFCGNLILQEFNKINLNHRCHRLTQIIVEQNLC